MKNKRYSWTRHDPDEYLSRMSKPDCKIRRVERKYLLWFCDWYERFKDTEGMGCHYPVYKIFRSELQRRSWESTNNLRKRLTRHKGRKNVTRRVQT